MVSEAEYKTILIGIVIGLLVGAGVGYLFSQSPIAGYKASAELLESKNLELQSRWEQLSEEYTDLQGRLDTVMSNLTEDRSSMEVLQIELSEIIAEYEALQHSYSELEEKYKEKAESVNLLQLDIYDLEETIQENEERIQLSDAYRRALENCMLNKRWDVFATYTGTAKASGELHFTTGDILIRAGEVMVDIRTYTNRYELLEVEMHPIGRGYTAYNLPWRYDSYQGNIWSHTYGYENIDYGKIYQLEIKGRYTDELIRKLNAGMTVDEELAYGYDYEIRIFIPEDSE